MPSYYHPTPVELEMESDFKSERELVENIRTALLETYDSPELAEDEQIVYAENFRTAHWPATLREGLVIKLANGSEFQITVGKVN